MTDLIDITAILRPGVYLLSKAGRVVYVGKARCLLLAIAGRKSIDRSDLPSWVPIPRITFDAVSIIPCDSTRAAALQKALITLHAPYHNRTPREAAPAGPFVPPAPATTVNPIRRL